MTPKQLTIYKDNTHRLAIEIILIFLVPVLLIHFGVIAPLYRIHLLFAVAVSVGALVVREGWTWHDLGFRMPSRRGIFLYSVSTLACVLCIYIYSLGLDLPRVGGRNFYIKLFLTFLPISFFQEFLYRGFLMHMLEKVYTDRVTILLYNASLFMLLHIIYPFTLAVLPLTFIGGIFLATLYMEEKNLFLITLTHAVLNFVAISLGFFVM